MRIKKTNTQQACNELHIAFKTYAGITSITKLNSHQMECYLGMIRMLCGRERAWMLTEPNEDESVFDLSMKDFLKLKLHNHE